MQIRISVIGDTVVVAPEGKLYSGENVERLEKHLAQIVRGGTTKVVIDLGDVESMDSTGIGVLIGFFSRGEKKSPKVQVIFANPRDMVRRIFDRMQLVTLLPVFYSLDAALGGFDKIKSTEL